jgi:hypothetical protein
MLYAPLIFSSLCQSSVLCRLDTIFLALRIKHGSKKILAILYTVGTGYPQKVKIRFNFCRMKEHEKPKTVRRKNNDTMTTSKKGFESVRFSDLRTADEIVVHFADNALLPPTPSVDVHIATV